MRQFSLPFAVTLTLLLSLILISCQSESKDAAKDEAREAIENNNASATTDGTVATQTAAQEEIPVGPVTTVEFEDSKHDYGVIEQGEKVAHVFKFKNTGNEPLVLSNVKPSCGCTTPKWTKEPVAPGEIGEIHVEFDSKGKSGKQTKTVTVTANTDPAKTVLTITGDVSKPEDAG